MYQTRFNEKDKIVMSEGGAFHLDLVCKLKLTSWCNLELALDDVAPNSWYELNAGLHSIQNV
jgi:hypothetical protein